MFLRALHYFGRLVFWRYFSAVPDKTWKRCSCVRPCWFMWCSSDSKVLKPPHCKVSGKFHACILSEWWKKTTESEVIFVSLALRQAFQDVLHIVFPTPSPNYKWLPYIIINELIRDTNAAVVCALNVMFTFISVLFIVSFFSIISVKFAMFLTFFNNKILVFMKQ